MMKKEDRGGLVKVMELGERNPCRTERSVLVRGFWQPRLGSVRHSTAGENGRRRKETSVPGTLGNVVVWRDDRSGTMGSFWTTMLRAGKHCRCRREAQQRRTVVRLRSLTREARSVDATASLRHRDCGHNERKKIEESGLEARCSSSNSQHDATPWLTHHGSIATVLRGSHENVQSRQPQKGVHDVTTR